MIVEKLYGLINKIFSSSFGDQSAKSVLDQEKADFFKSVLIAILSITLEQPPYVFPHYRLRLGHACVIGGWGAGGGGG